MHLAWNRQADGVTRRWTLCAAAAAALSLVSACSADRSDPPGETTAPTVPYGFASVEPSTVKQGNSIVVTPAAEIEPICTATIAVVYTATAVPERVFQLVNGQAVTWVSYATTQPTFPACIAPRSSASERFLIARDFPEGDYLVCITWGLDQNGCGRFTVEAP